MTACAGLLLAGLLTSTANAAERKWDGGGGDNNWTTADNWVNNEAPLGDGTDTLTFAGTTRLAPFNNFAAGTQFNSISFDGTAGAFTLTGNRINLGGDLSDSATATQIIRIPMTLLQNTNASVVTGGNLTLNAGGVLLTPVITNGGVSSVTINNAGAGLAPNTTYPITFSLPATVGGRRATGTLTTSATGTVVTAGITITDAGTGYAAGNNFAGLAILNEDATPRSLTKSGPGTLTLGSLNTFTGGTTVAVDGGILTLGFGGIAGTIRNTLTINDRAIVNLNATDALGFAAPLNASNPPTKVDNVFVNGGTLNNSANVNNLVRTNINLTGGTLSSTGGGSTFIESPFRVTTFASANSSLISANFVLRSTSTTGTLPVVFDVADGAAANDLLVTGVLSNQATTSLVGLNKIGAGTMAIGGTGTTTTPFTAATITAGTLQLAAANRIPDAATMNLSGGTFNTAGFNETVGALSLTANSNIDFGAGSSTLSYSGVASATSFTSGQTLSLLNYTPGSDRLFIGGAIAPSTDQLAQISFVLPSGNVTAQRLSSGEIVPAGSVTEVFWTGDKGNNWSTNIGGDTNWATDITGATDLGRIPGAGDNVVFAANNVVAGSLNTVLGADFSIRGLVVNTNAAAGLTVGGANNLTLGLGGISVLSGAGVTTINTSGQVILGSDQFFTNNNIITGNALIISSVISGGFGITKTGTGPMTLSGANTYTGATTINGGPLTVSGGSSLSDTAAVVTSNIAGVSLTLTNNETVGSLSGGGTTGGGIALVANTLTINGDPTAASFAGIISGTGSVVKSGTGFQTLSAANTFTGPQTVSSGTLTLSGLSGTAGPTVTTVNGGTLNLSAGGGTGAIRGTLNINAGATVNMTAGNALGFTVNLSVTQVNINGGTLNNQVNDNNGFLANFSLNGATIAQTVAPTGTTGINFSTGFGITTTGTPSVISAPVVLRSATSMPITVAAGADLSITGPIIQNGTGFGFTKAGAGTLLLSGASTYSGVTTISAGILQLGASDRLPNNSGVTLSGGTFNTAGFSDTVGALTLPDTIASTLDFGTGTSVLRFSGFGTTTGTVNVLNFTSGSDQLFIGTTKVLTDAQLGQIKFVIGGNQVSAFQRNTGEVVPAIPSSATTGAVISEYRLSGPGSGANSDLDEFIEIFNQTNSALDVGGFTVVAGGVTIPIPAGSSIPAKGHMLLTNSGGYSLGSYGGANAATGDVTYTGDIALGSPIALNSASGTAIDTVTNVGLTPTTATSQYSYARRLSLDTGLASSNASDFNLVDVGATTFGPDSVNDTSNGKLRLGSPGPENLSSPLNRSVLYTNLSANASDNSVRNATDTSQAPLGTLSLRRTVTNNTGTTLTKVRFRLINTTSGTPTVSSLADVRVVDGTASFVVGGVTVMPITVEKVAGATTGSLNSTFTLPLPAGGLTNGSSVSIDFKLGVFKAGSYRLAFLFEVLP